MTSPQSAHRDATHIDDVVGVEVTIDGMLVIADRLGLMEFPTALGIRLNIPQPDLRNIVWEQRLRRATEPAVLATNHRGRTMTSWMCASRGALTASAMTFATVSTLRNCSGS
jgi:hypothetical protein